MKPSPITKPGKPGRFEASRLAAVLGALPGIGLHYRALGMAVDDGILWFWIGTHAEYDDIVS
jgi:hypothetical protein